MLKNYIITGIRNILKHKFYSLINILGLTIGITAALFIVLYIIDELSYEDFHKDADRIYRIGLVAQLSGQNIQVFSSPPPMAKAMEEEIPEVESACRLWNWEKVIIRYNENSYTEDKFYLVDTNFFEIFTFELVRGDPATVFLDPESIVLTETMAKKYFGDEDPMDKILTVANHRQAMKVTGVAADPPHNTHIRFNFLLPIYSQQHMRNNDRWLNNFLRTYFKVYPDSDMSRVQSKLKDMVIQHVGPELQQAMGISIEQFTEQEDGAYGFVFDPIQDIHLKSNLQHELEPPSDIKYLYIFGAIGIFILVIGSINFMNLSTARSAGRTREVGM
ncbi:MAG: ABC transporter permease, partial [Cyclobacteriaceae bacterium]|nr:ABC transporter permease [Cyclobacteriaceae bacterium]